MNQPIEIKFDFPLAHSDLVISLTATVDLHHSPPYYVVDHFHFAGTRPVNDGLSLLPPQELKQVTRGDKRVWVHKDSERESLLSLAIGKAIESGLKDDQIAG